MHPKAPWNYSKRVRESDLSSPRLPILAKVGNTGPQWCPTAVICIKVEEEDQQIINLSAILNHAVTRWPSTNQG
jgi:hypothetical protein